MNKDKYIGKQWISTGKNSTEHYYILDIVNHGLYRFDDHREIYSMLAIKIKFSNFGDVRYSITNPGKQYAEYYEEFFTSLKKDSEDMHYDCLKFLFDKGLSKWATRYSGHKNLIGKRI